MNKFIATLAFILLPCIARANDITIEDKDFFPAPPEAVMHIPAQTGWKDEKCELTAKWANLNGHDEHSGLFVTTKDGCGWGNAATQVWVLRHRGNGYDIVLDNSSYRITFLVQKHKGLRDITTSQEGAVNYEIQFWSFNGRVYRKIKEYAFRANDKQGCEEHPDICPFHFNN